MPIAPDRRLVRVARHVVLRAATLVEDAVRAAAKGLHRFYNSNDLTYASSVAFFALMSLFPCLMLLLSLLGSATASDADRTRVVEFLFRYFPRQFEFLTAQLDAFRGQRISLGLAGGLLTAWGALGVFGAITTAVNYAWRVDRQPTYFKHKLISFLMMLAAGALMLLALGMISASHVVRASWFASVADRTPWLMRLTGTAVEWATTFMLILVVGLVFYFVPNTRVRFRDVWIGAVLTGFLWRAGFALFSWYVNDVSRFSIHGSIAAVVMFLLWVYLSSVILLYGVEYTAAYAQMRRARFDDPSR
ncbi:MAG: YihY/virulence factor BrkB family protein [Acidobacteria bacterium]|jgi:membrane protein|nr:YihY/virulence factor BrkB family protein [Acidobacteriota bacterium]